VVASRHALERTYGRAGDLGQRNRFAVTGNPDGGHNIALGDSELARVTTDADGNLTIEITNKPTGGASSPGVGTGETGTANENGGGGVPAQTEPVTASARRAFAGQRNRMSWERDPASGGVMFTPADNEVLDVDGDSIQAVVSAHPTPGMRNI
jgi:hypothetical protein